MPSIGFTRAALYDIERQIDFLLLRKHFDKAEQLSKKLKSDIAQLGHNPYLGRKFDDDNHELIIPFSTKTVYLALYHYDKVAGSVTIIAIKNAREKSYTGF